MATNTEEIIADLAKLSRADVSRVSEYCKRLMRVRRKRPGKDKTKDVSSLIEALHNAKLPESANGDSRLEYLLEKHLKA